MSESFSLQSAQWYTRRCRLNLIVNDGRQTNDGRRTKEHTKSITWDSDELRSGERISIFSWQYQKMHQLSSHLKCAKVEFSASSLKQLKSMFLNILRVRTLIFCVKLKCTSMLESIWFDSVLSFTPFVCISWKFLFI